MVAEVPRMLTNLNLVAAGAGVSVVPASMRGVHLHAVAYVPLLESPPLDAPMTLTWRRSDQAGPTATFVALARQMAQAEVRAEVRAECPVEAPAEGQAERQAERQAKLGAKAG